jgi:transcriptional regulator with XRE-family HTH domain
MSVGIADIAASIRQARKDKALTQRELGQRVGLPQSHISKIESGVVDLQLSSLAEIARALDLEVKLLPRKALPAIEGTVRAAVGTAGSSATSRALDSIQKELQFAKSIKAAHPQLTQIDNFQSALKSIQNLPTLHIDSQALKSLHDALRPAQTIASLIDKNSPTAKLAKQLEESTSALRQWRNLQVHLPQIDGPRQRPAYRLEDDE